MVYDFKVIDKTNSRISSALVNNISNVLTCFFEEFNSFDNIPFFRILLYDECNPYDLDNYIYLNIADLKAGEPIIYVNLFNLVINSSCKYELSSLVKDIFLGDMVHELAHIWHYSHFKGLSRIVELPLSFSNPLRAGLNFFYTRLPVEGLAKYFEQPYYKTSIDYHTLSFELAFLTDRVANKASDLFFTFNSLSYNTGYYMIKALVEEMPIEKIARLSYPSFIKLYEKSMLSNGSKPLVSWNSKSGIVDYSTILDKLVWQPY